MTVPEPKDLARLAEALPIKDFYEDALQPAAREVGKGLETVAKTINAALLPLRVAVWGFDRIERWLIPELAERLQNVPQERIQMPSPMVAGPAIEALRFAASDETLRGMYANLLATSMDRDTARDAHPAFVEILKQLSPDEARIIRVFRSTATVPAVTVNVVFLETDGSIPARRNFSLLAESAGCEHPELLSTYTDNLIRLGLLEIPPLQSFTNKEQYRPLEEHDQVLRDIALINKLDGRKGEVDQHIIRLTSLGAQFIKAVLGKDA